MVHYMINLKHYTTLDYKTLIDEFHFRVIDLGVMTPCDKILKSAIEEKAGFYMITSILVYSLILY